MSFEFETIVTGDNAIRRILYSMMPQNNFTFLTATQVDGVEC